MAELAVNNKTYLATKVSLFMMNYRRKMRIEVNIRKKEKVEKVMEFVEKIKKIQEDMEPVLKKIQEEIKQQADRRKRKVKE